MLLDMVPEASQRAAYADHLVRVTSLHRVALGSHTITGTEDNIYIYRTTRCSVPSTESLTEFTYKNWNRDSSVSKVTRLRAGRQWFDCRQEQELISLCYRVQTHPAFYPVDISGSFPGDKVAGG